MKLFVGLGRTDYQDVLRALGYLCDERGWRNLRLFEQDDGLIVQYTTAPDSQEFVVAFMSDDDLRQLLQQAYTRRGKDPPQRYSGGAPASHSP